MMITEEIESTRETAQFQEISQQSSTDSDPEFQNELKKPVLIPQTIKIPTAEEEEIIDKEIKDFLVVMEKEEISQQLLFESLNSASIAKTLVPRGQVVDSEVVSQIGSIRNSQFATFGMKKGGKHTSRFGGGVDNSQEKTQFVDNDGNSVYESFETFQAGNGAQEEDYFEPFVRDASENEKSSLESSSLKSINNQSFSQSFAFLASQCKNKDNITKSNASILPTAQIEPETNLQKIPKNDPDVEEFEDVKDSIIKNLNELNNPQMSETLMITKATSQKLQKDSMNLHKDELTDGVFSRNCISVRYLGKQSGLFKYVDMDPYFFMYVSGNNECTTFELKFK